MKEKEIFLKELKSLLMERFGDNIQNVILFGSQAKGLARKNSDYDILIVTNHDYDWHFEDQITSELFEMEMEYNVFIDTKVISTNEINNTLKGKEPLYTDALRDGLHI